MGKVTTRKLDEIMIRLITATKEGKIEWSLDPRAIYPVVDTIFHGWVLRFYANMNPHITFSNLDLEKYEPFLVDPGDFTVPLVDAIIGAMKEKLDENGAVDDIIEKLKPYSKDWSDKVLS